MTTVYVFGSDRKQVAENIEELTEFTDLEIRVNWMLVSSFVSPKGGACYAPGFPEIQQAYEEAGLAVIDIEGPDED